MVWLRTLIAALAALALTPPPAHALTSEKLGRVPDDTTAMTPAPRSGGAFFVASRIGGRRDCGEIRLLLGRTSRPVFAFNGYNGKAPVALQTVGRTVYGVTAEGGQFGEGVLFRLRGRGIQVLHHFDEETGSPFELKVSGGVVYGATQYGVFVAAGKNVKAHRTGLPNGAARIGGDMFVSGAYSSGLFELIDGEEELVAEDFPNRILAAGPAVVGFSQYGGTHGYGSVWRYDPATRRAAAIVQFQSYNGGYPTAAAALRNGTLYTTNGDGIWRIAAQPRKLLPWGDVSLLASDGRRLFGVRGSYSRRTGFVVKP